MCGPFIHGHYWYKKGVLKIFIDLVNNSHSGSKSFYDKIPDDARRCGINPINGEPVTNDSEPLPEDAKIELSHMFNTHFSGRNNIHKWIKDNYGANQDKEEWEIPMLQMVENSGNSIFNIGYYKGSIEGCKSSIEVCKSRIGDCKGKIEDYKGRIGNCKGKIEDCKGKIEDCKGSIEDYKSSIEDYKSSIEDYKSSIGYYKSSIGYCKSSIEGCKSSIKYCKGSIKDYKGRIEDCTGTLSHFAIEPLLVLFKTNPSKFWSERNTESDYKPYLEN